MAKLTIIENGMSSADMITAINANFVFINSLQALSTSLITITNAMQGQSLLDNINANFIALNARAISPATLSSINLGITGSVLNTLFTNLLEAVGRGMNGLGYFVEYEESTLHLCTTRGDKILAFDGVDTVSLSLNNGKTYPYSYQIVGMEDIISFAYIWLTGEIMFCTHTKVYYSHDNLTTVNESSVIGIDGNPFVPPVSYGNFAPLGLGQYHKDDFPYWGTYAAENDTPINQCLAWYSIDKGVTVKAWFKTDLSFGIPVSGHIHNINYDINSDTFILCMGDGDNACRWIKAIYNTQADTWTLTLLKAGLNNGIFKTTGFVWRGEDVYWASDSVTHAELQGIWTCKYADILDEEKYVRAIVHDNDIYTIIGDDSEMIFSDTATGKFYFSFDMSTLYSYTVPFSLEVGDRGGFLVFTPKNTNGYYRCEIWSTTERAGGIVIKNMYKGPVMLIKINH